MTVMLSREAVILSREAAILFLSRGTDSRRRDLTTTTGAQSDSLYPRLSDCHFIIISVCNSCASVVLPPLASGPDQTAAARAIRLFGELPPFLEQIISPSNQSLSR
eukprot:959134-Prorocentrum_minimum.AAC.1